MKRYELYVFDLDNTLYDENSFLKQAYYNIACYLEDKAPQQSKENYYMFLWSTFLKKGRKNLFNHCLEHFSLSSLIEMRCLKTILYDTAKTGEFILYPWVKPCFDFFLAQGKNLAILTNGNLRQQQYKIQALGLNKLYELGIICYADSFKHPKPHPASLLNVIETAKVALKDAIMIGDHEVDKLCAAQAGIDFIDNTCFSQQIMELNFMLTPR